MLGLVLLTALVPPPVDPAPAGGQPPTQMMASIDGAGQLRLVCVASSGCDVPGREFMVPPPMPGGPGRNGPQVKVKLTTLVVTTAELEAKHVQAFTTDGRPIPAEKLATLLAKEKPVLVSCDGKKVDPFLLALYKEDTIVLVPPANALPMGGGGPAAIGVPFGGQFGVGVTPVPQPNILPMPGGIRKVAPEPNREIPRN
jgi:hypothetical protein